MNEKKKNKLLDSNSFMAYGTLENDYLQKKKVHIILSLLNIVDGFKAHYL